MAKSLQEAPSSQKSNGKVDGSVISNYDRSRNGGRAEASDLVLVKYKCETNGVPITATSGSTLPLVTGSSKDIEIGYNPFEYRKVSHPTTDFETLIHLLKGSLGTGILAMPLAFKNAGLFFGLTATFLIGVICTYCIHILVKCSHILCRRSKVPSLGYADVAEVAFLTGRPSLRKYSGIARKCVDLFLILDLLGCCCVYVVFVSKNLKQVVDFYFGVNCDIRIYMLFLLPFLLLLNLIRNLKYLAPFSMVANLLMGVAMTITFYYIFEDLPSIGDLPLMADWNQLPLFFGTAIFALEGIGVVMPLENNMKTPYNFIGCPGVLNIGMTVVVILYSTFGFFGYLKYGDDTEGSITLNLPSDEKLAQLVKVAIAVAIFITYSLQFYVPMEIIWKYIKHKFTSHSLMIENTIRMTLVTATVLVAVAIPDLGPFISLVGAVCLSMLGLIFPSIIELITYRDEPGYGRLNWVVWKNFAIIAFGILGFLTGTFTSLQEIITHLQTMKLH